MLDLEAVYQLYRPMSSDGRISIHHSMQQPPSNMVLSVYQLENAAFFRVYAPFSDYLLPLLLSCSQ
ncbi:hypothetical protein SLEP1_g18723 [Rubroshorea leprosula]|uniref:Uncharacterized protein n=1 Tax=Rubroshorea leprosula TaxID=152421 RepID=A0AAV5J427_9ROSI|nr:hypothetical protein SLEP1_g18723 [Rubroshorea leprosula]